MGRAVSHSTCRMRQRIHYADGAIRPMEPGAVSPAVERAEVPTSVGVMRTA